MINLDKPTFAKFRITTIMYYVPVIMTKCLTDFTA
jgi:hypothetical protein